jgi:hypothetical protein
MIVIDDDKGAASRTATISDIVIIIDFEVWQEVEVGPGCHDVGFQQKG